MTNYSDLSRKEQVLERLRRAGGEWVDGSELATAEVGGSEGLRRLRELRAEGVAIEQRAHPDKGRDVSQYRLAAAALLPEGFEQQSLFGEAPPPPSKGHPQWWDR